MLNVVGFCYGGTSESRKYTDIEFSDVARHLFVRIPLPAILSFYLSIILFQDLETIVTPLHCSCSDLFQLLVGATTTIGDKLLFDTVPFDPGPLESISPSTATNPKRTGVSLVRFAGRELARKSNLRNPASQIKALKESKSVYVSIICNLAGITHPTFSSEPVPLSLSPKLSNHMGLEASVEATTEFLNKAVKTVLVAGLKLSSKSSFY